MARLYREQLKGQADPVGVFRSICVTVRASDHHMSKRAYSLPESLFRTAERRETWTLDAMNGNRAHSYDRPEGRRL